MPAANLCGCYLTCLQRLSQLSLYSCDFPREDAFHLTRLSRLTSLELLRCQYVDEAVLVALATSLINLHELSLEDCGMVLSDAPVPALRGLQGLRSLSLEGCKGLRDGSANLLAQVMQLTQLKIRGQHQLTEAGTKRPCCRCLVTD